jgi:hypothetical protein
VGQEGGGVKSESSMKDKLIAILVLVALAAVLIFGATRFHRRVVESWVMEFPVDGLVVSDDGTVSFERVPLEDCKNLSRLGFPAAMRQQQAHIRHLVIHLDGHYFFTTDGRVLVMALSPDGRTPRLLETKHWSSAPHDFRDYRTELLPSP